VSTFISIGAAAQQIADRLQRLQTEEQLLAAIEAAGPSLAAATEIVQQHQGFIEALPKHLRAALLDQIERVTWTSFELPAQPAGGGVMSRFRRQKQSTRIMPGSAICCDCGTNTVPSGKPKPGTHEQFIVNDNVWIAAGMTPGKVDKNNELIGGGILCVGCIENRLGRRLTVNDFKPITLPLLLSSPWITERLRSRALYPTQAAEDAAKLAPPIKWTADFAPDGFGMATSVDLEPETETSFGWSMP
jgi:hypothetical protein